MFIIKTGVEKKFKKNFCTAGANQPIANKVLRGRPEAKVEDGWTQTPLWESEDWRNLEKNVFSCMEDYFDDARSEETVKKLLADVAKVSTKKGSSIFLTLVIENKKSHPREIFSPRAEYETPEVTEIQPCSFKVKTIVTIDFSMGGF